MTYWVRLGTLPAGNYEFDLLFTPTGASEPSKHRIGVISQGATTPGYYTRSYTVSVPYQVWVPPTGNGGEGGEGGEGGTPGYWKTEYRQETRYEQVWVNAVTPRPGMSHTTATYVAGYIPGRPTSYSLSSTTGSNPRPISTNVSGILGVVASWGTSGPNGGAVTSRPSVERTYDRWGNVLTVSDPRSPYWITRYTYNAANQITSEIRPSADGAAGAGPATYLYYDAQGQQRRHARRQRQPDRHGVRRRRQAHRRAARRRRRLPLRLQRLRRQDQLDRCAGQRRPTPMTGWAA